MAATTKQIEFARDLYRTIRDERVADQSVLDEMTARVNAYSEDTPKDFSDNVISWAIEQRDSLPRAPKQGDREVKVEDGRYAIDYGNGVVKFFRVNTPDEGKWAGYTFVKEQASDELYPVKDRERRETILDLIAQDPEEAARLYGTELGVCGICGRTLTDPESRAFGVGPVCRENRGW